MQYIIIGFAKIYNNTVPQKIDEIISYNFFNFTFCVEYEKEYHFCYSNRFLETAPKCLILLVLD